MLLGLLCLILVIPVSSRQHTVNDLSSEEEKTLKEVRELLKSIVIDNEDNSNTTVALPSSTMACPLPRTMAKTTINSDDITANLQYWLLKPKLHLLRQLHPKLSAKVDSPYNEKVLKEDGKMVVVYEFQQPTDCQNLIALSEKIVSYSSDVDQLTVDCECTLYVIKKTLQ
ncbi:unnamed protein product [Bursaphelenchus okinawaensis]|uniref:Uncharacterized protein n=1 Tax=Bursaphelenchus okinawaensis TaxID=465554 RepID=A0A811LCH3_9BILA|nr:unnamed protein product [Bursaphelenchus okinawaensis]CAG9120360.1 unnamed protein product [Bursaphelenchus okinawaensis]